MKNGVARQMMMLSADDAIGDESSAFSDACRTRFRLWIGIQFALKYVAVMIGRAHAIHKRKQNQKLNEPRRACHCKNDDHRREHGSVNRQAHHETPKSISSSPKEQKEHDTGSGQTNDRSK